MLFVANESSESVVVVVEVLKRVEEGEPAVCASPSAMEMLWTLPAYDVDVRRGHDATP